MNLYSDVDYDFDDTGFFSDYSETNINEILHQRQFRKILEDKLEKKRLMEDLEELDTEFNWDDL